ncbi:MAG: tetratricopeptide repeat protein [Bacteroidales bacterium]|nr:tetratricopeptide repeat protein [Bacteroidales bacterium]
MRKPGWIFFLILSFLIPGAVSGQYREAIMLSLAQTYADSGQFEVSIGIYSRLIAEFPDDAHLYLQRGVNRYRLERLQEAEEDFTMALEKDPQLVEAFLYRYRVRLRLKEVAGAVADLDQARRLDFYKTITNVAGGILWGTLWGTKRHK